MADIFNDYERLVKSGDPQELELGILEFGRFIDSGEQSVIDVALIKLTDLFVSVSSDFRLLIVAQIEMYHTELNRCHLVAAQVLRKLTYVWESNDVLGKVTVIKIFGLLPELVKNSSESCYRVIISLDSSLVLLRNAALNASMSLSASSAQFVEMYIAKLSLLRITSDEFLYPLQYAYAAPNIFTQALSILLQAAPHSQRAQEILYMNALRVELAAKCVIENNILPQDQVASLKNLFQ